MKWLLYAAVLVALLSVSHVAGGIHVGFTWLWG